MTARYPLVRVGADISELPAGDTLIGASSYTLPVATSTELGGVKVDGTTITITTGGVISAVSSYTLPVATDLILGGVKVDGTSITVDGTGVITANLAGSTTQLKQLIKNATGSILYKGQAVYISGAAGANVQVSLAQANTEATSSKTLGLLETDIAINGTGYVITEGQLINFNTNAAGNEGDSVWLSPTTAGGLVYGLANKPVAPNHMVYLGVVSRKNASNGVILIKVQNGYELDELHNVLITTPVNGHVLKYDSVTSLWGNDVITYSELSGTVPTWNQNTTGYSANIAGGLIGSIPYQSAANTTAFLAAGTSGYILKSNGNAAPSWLQTLPTTNGGTGSTATAYCSLTANVTDTLPIGNGGTGITSFGTGIATFLGTPSSANLAAALTDETGTGVNVFATSPTLVTPTLTGTKEVKVAMGANAIDLTVGNYFTKTFTAGAAALTVTNIPTTGTVASFILDMTNAGLATITFSTGFTSVKWVGGSGTPTLTSAGRDVLGFYTHDAGATWVGLVLGKDVK